MFSKKEVDTLFTESSKAVQRSQLLLEERSRVTPSGTLSVTPKSPSFDAALRSLRSLMDFAAFLDASNTVGQRLLKECRMPSPAMQRKRRDGSACPLLRRVVDGITGVQDLWGCKDSSAEDLWSEGAVVSAKLVLAGLFADWLHSTGAAVLAKSPSPRELCGDDLLGLLGRVRACMPGAVADELDAEVLRVACSIPCSSEGLAGTTATATATNRLSALLLFPTLIPYVVLHAAPSLVTERVLSLVERAAAELFPAYLSGSPADFFSESERLVRNVVLAARYAAFGIEVSGAGNMRRVVGFTKQLFDSLLLPVEGAFAAALPCVGMTIDVHKGLCEPFCRLVRSWTRQEQEESKMEARETTGAKTAINKQALFSVWFTASYRTLVIVETLAQAELGVVSGRGNTMAQQKKYYSMLQQSNGKVTVAILLAVTEDKQLLFEETTTRSSEGHKVYRIHQGGNKPSVFVYLDNGIVCMKVGRDRAFRRAKSVEEVFSIFV